MGKFIVLLVVVSSWFAIISKTESTAATSRFPRPSCWIEIRGDESVTYKVLTTCHRWAFRSIDRSINDDNPFDIQKDYLNTAGIKKSVARTAVTVMEIMDGFGFDMSGQSCYGDHTESICQLSFLCVDGESGCM